MGNLPGGGGGVEFESGMGIKFDGANCWFQSFHK